MPCKLRGLRRHPYDEMLFSAFRPLEVTWIKCLYSGAVCPFHGEPLQSKTEVGRWVSIAGVLWINFRMPIFIFSERECMNLTIEDTSVENRVDPNKDSQEAPDTQEILKSYRDAFLKVLGRIIRDDTKGGSNGDPNLMVLNFKGPDNGDDYLYYEIDDSRCETKERKGAKVSSLLNSVIINEGSGTEGPFPYEFQFSFSGTTDKLIVVTTQTVGENHKRLKFFTSPVTQEIVLNPLGDEDDTNSRYFEGKRVNNVNSGEYVYPKFFPKEGLTEDKSGFVFIKDDVLRTYYPRYVSSLSKVIIPLSPFVCAIQFFAKSVSWHW